MNVAKQVITLYLRESRSTINRLTGPQEISQFPYPASTAFDLGCARVVERLLWSAIRRRTRKH